MWLNNFFMMLKAGLTAQRFAGKPLKQPGYSFRDVPKCERDLVGSSLQEADDRQHFTDSMAEMLLLCNEVMRRQALAEQEKIRNNAAKGETAKPTKRPAKPLSLEYIADRIDVDDPIFGYFVRNERIVSESTAVIPANSVPCNEANTLPRTWKKGMLQGFITVTTFTNWQKSFRWDSMNDSAFSYDDEELAKQMLSGERLYDRDGTLAEEMQATVRCGDPWNEGIVWPRIAEISLLGALGCGKALLSLVIEQLECMTATGKQNYDYVVLQATDNSIPFYESMGFVRVGCITEDEKIEETQSKSESSKQNEVSTASDFEKVSSELVAESESIAASTAEVIHDPVEKVTADLVVDAVAEKLGEDAKGEEAVDNTTEHDYPAEVVSSPVDTYVTQKPGELLSEIARRLKVNVWDIIFLNQHLFPDIVPRSRLMKGTSLLVPSETAKYDAISHAGRAKAAAGKTSAVQWYIAEDNETPKVIAKKFKVSCRKVVDGNKERIPDLQNLSRLIEGTRLKVSHFDLPHDKHVPYCHWTFPDDTLESSEPSYMMAKKLNRRRGAAAKNRPVQSSFAVAVTKYIPVKTAPPPLVTTKNVSNQDAPGSRLKRKTAKKRKRHPDEPIPPKKPMTAYFYFMCEMRDGKMKNEMAGKPMKEVLKAISLLWKEVSDSDKAKYEQMNSKAREDYRLAMEKYESEMDAFRKDNPEWLAEQDRLSVCSAMSEEQSTAEPPHGKSRKAAAKKEAKPKNLFNKVVKLNSGGVTQAGSEYKYYYVLTYLPDLQWCHLAPMRKVGVWGPEKPKAEGRPIWMLVDENEGKEIDISASFCETLRSRAMKRVPDADKEQWDIFESGPRTTAKDETSTEKENGGKSLNGAPSMPSIQLAAGFTNRAKDGFKRKEQSPVNFSRDESQSAIQGATERPQTPKTTLTPAKKQIAMLGQERPCASLESSFLRGNVNNTHADIPRAKQAANGFSPSIKSLPLATPFALASSQVSKGQFRKNKSSESK